MSISPKTLCIIAWLSTCGSAAANAQTVRTLWQGIDVRALPLQVQNLEEVKEGNVVIRKLMYASQQDGEFRVRILAYYGFPASGKKLPAILHIHGGGQTANRDYVRYFAQRGYAAISIDWGGNPLSSGGGNSEWGRLAVEQSDNARVFQISSDLRQNPWFYWAVACRRAITFLEQQPEVDAGRIGIFGVSMGGRLAWLVAGTDSRVKAAVSIYGAIDMATDIPGVPGSEQVSFSASEAEIWKRTLDAAAYAPEIRCPFLYLSAADDYYGSMDFADRELNRIVQAPHWQSFTPHFNHHVEPAQSASLLLWMDRWLKDGPGWPQTPKLELQSMVRDGSAQLLLTPDRPQDITAVSIYYSTGPWPQSRFWRESTATPDDGKWKAQAPVAETAHGLFGFANVKYRSGMSMSSKLLAVPQEVLVKLGVKATGDSTTLIDDFARGAADWFVPDCSVDPLLQERTWFRAIEGPSGDKAVTFPETQGIGWRMATRKVGDPQWRGPAGAGIRVRVHSEKANTVLVVATENERRRPFRTRIYIAQAALKGGSWETVDLPLWEFRSVDGDGPLASWDEVNLLTIQGRYLMRGKDHPAGSTIGSVWNGPSPEVGRIEWTK